MIKHFNLLQSPNHHACELGWGF